MGDSKQAIALLNEILQTGFWYGETLLRKSPSYQSLQGLPEFEALVDQNRRLREQDEHKSYPLLTIHPEGKCVGGDIPCTLLLGLHANASTAQNELEFGDLFSKNQLVRNL